MFRRLACLVLLGFAAFAVAARPGEFAPSDAEVRAAIERVLEAQLAAFRRPDYAAAHEFAAAPLREKFPAAQYEQMIRRGYPRVARHTAARLGEVRDDGERALVVVVLADPDGTEAAFRWLLAREPAGWRVAGVAEIAPPRGGT